MKKIALIVQKLNGGGAERTASNLSIILSKNYEVHLFVFDTSNITYPYGGTLHDINVPPKKGLLKLFNLWIRVHRVKKLKKTLRIDKTISFMDGANYVNVLSKVKDKTIISIRNQKSKMFSSRFTFSFRMFKHSCKKADLIVALSCGVKTDLIQNYHFPSEKIVVIYNPCDAKLLRSQFSTRSNTGDHSIITMGRLENQKGQWHLIKAMSYVVKEVPDATLYIFGDGTLKDELQQLVNKLNIEKNVFFMGFVKAPHSYFCSSSLFVFPSLYEGLGNVILEAMAFGMPVIATDCFSGPREILNPGTDVVEHFDNYVKGEYGLLVSVGSSIFNSDIEKSDIQLSLAIIDMLKNDSLKDYYRKKSLERVQMFSPETIANEWGKILDE